MGETRNQAGAARREPAPAAPEGAAAGLNDRPGVPSGPTEMGGGSWVAAGKRTLREFGNDQLQDRAAALTYYAVLSIFPGLLVVISLLGLVGKSATQPLITNLTQAAPGTVRQIIVHAVSNLQNGHGSAGFA